MKTGMVLLLQQQGYLEIKKLLLNQVRENKDLTRIYPMGIDTC